MVINFHKGKESEIGLRKDCWQEGTEQFNLSLASSAINIPDCMTHWYG